jgi:signal peptidase II
MLPALRKGASTAMGAWDMSQGGADMTSPVRWRLWGPASGIGVVAAALTFVLDQAHKYWMLDIYRIAERGRVQITSYFDLVMAWNKGVSYGLFAQHSNTGRLILIGVSLIAVTGLLIWMANSLTRLAGLSLGLIIGGALGNLTDRIVHGAVADFFHFHYAGFSWYIFNIADIAIVAGVIGLLLDWMLQSNSEDAA